MLNSVVNCDNANAKQAHKNLTNFFALTGIRTQTLPLQGNLGVQCCSVNMLVMSETYTIDKID